MNITRVHGGQLNRLWRFDTADGSFAVKELNNDRGWTYRFDDVFRFEQAAFAAGIPMPEPVGANETVLIHRWVDGEPVPSAPVASAFAAEVGALLARLHALDVPWTHVSIPDPMPTEDEWAALAARAAGQPWAEDLTAIIPVLGTVGRFVDDTGQPEPMVLAHKDISQKNLLSVDGHPVLVDWEIAGKLPLAFELGKTGAALASDHGRDLQPAVFRAFLSGYVDAGGTLPTPGPHWFVDLVGGAAGWLWMNVERCVTGVEPASGGTLADAHDVVREALHSIPTQLAQVPRLAELTVR